MNKLKAIIIYLDNSVLLSKKLYCDWREVQNEFWDNYKTNLEPMTCNEIISFFKDDFKEEKNWPFTMSEIISFFESNSEVICSKEDI